MSLFTTCTTVSSFVVFFLTYYGISFHLPFVVSKLHFLLFYFIFRLWLFIYLFIYLFKKIIYLFLFSYNCLHFLPLPPPHPSQSHLPPAAPPPQSCPGVQNCTLNITLITKKRKKRKTSPFDLLLSNSELLEDIISYAFLVRSVPKIMISGD